MMRRHAVTSLVHDRYSHRLKKTLAVCSSTKACSITHELWSILPPVRHHCQRRRSKRRRRRKVSFNKIPHLDNQRLSLVGSYNSRTWPATKKTTKNSILLASFQYSCVVCDLSSMQDHQMQFYTANYLELLIRIYESGENWLQMKKHKKAMHEKAKSKLLRSS